MFSEITCKKSVRLLRKADVQAVISVTRSNFEIVSTLIAPISDAM